MIIELGHYALILALATVIIQSVLPLVGTIRGAGTTVLDFS